MALPTDYPKSPQASSKLARANAAVKLAQAGDYDAAKVAFEAALSLDRRNLSLQFNLAVVEEHRGDIDQAARWLTTVLNEKPGHPQAAVRLSRLLARFQIADFSMLVPGGLRAALLAPDISHQPIVDATVDWLFSQSIPWSDAAKALEAGATEERLIGVSLVDMQAAANLQDELLALALRQGIIKRAGVERVLTGVRAALLLDCALDRFDDRRLMDWALALLVQGWNNDHAWAETTEETAALNAHPIDRSALVNGDREAARRYLLQALYRPLPALVSPHLSIEDARQIKPRSLRDVIEPHVRSQIRQQELAARINMLRPLVDQTSLKVASQYEAAPYPRWTSLHKSPPGALKAALSKQADPERLAFMDVPFDVLIAGCGTGQQALQAASAYGPLARIIGLDLSLASLGYAADQARVHGIDTVSFQQGDILDAALLDRDFDIIECVGVLHHMADWRQGWVELLRRLKPSGIMYLGFYSAVARADLKALRTDAAYPGPGCSDAAARVFRRALMLRSDQGPGSTLSTSRDFYALNAFRDLVLHESEAHVSLAEIDDFLQQNNLVFRGFTLEGQVVGDFKTAFPDRPMPGRLEDWAVYENAHPRTFDAMYRFWIERRN